MRGRALLLAASVLAVLSVAELGLAVAAPQIHRLPEVWEHDPRLGWRHIPGARGRLVTPEFDVEYRIDERGRRDHPHAVAGAGVEQILLFGDSFAEGWGVEVEQGLAARLEARLMESGRRVVVHNHGVAGYGTDQAMLLFEAAGAPRGTRVVVLLFYGNDLWNNVSRRGIGAERGLKPYYRIGRSGELRLAGVPVPEPPPRPRTLERYLTEHWHLFALLRKAMRSTALPGAQLRDFYGGLYARDGARFLPVWNLTERLLSRFAERVRGAGARFVLVYAPSIVQIEPDDWRAKRDRFGLTDDYDLGNPNRRLAGIADRQGIEYLDLVPAFASAAQHATLFFRDSHWNAAGHELAAAAVAAFLSGGDDD